MAGQLIKLGEGRWRTRIFLGRGADGKRKYLSKNLRCSKKEAEEFLRMRLSEMHGGGYKTAGILTVSEFTAKWLGSIRGTVRERTLADYAQCMKTYVLPRIGHLSLLSVTPLVMTQLIGELSASGLAPRSVRKPIEVCRNAFEFAVIGDLLKSNPARNRLISRTLPRAHSPVRQTISVATVPAFRAAVEGDRMSAYYLLLLLGGLRPEEALALRWSDLRSGAVSVGRVLVDRPGCPFIFEATKSASSRRLVGLPKLVIDELARHSRRQAAEQLKAGLTWEANDLIFCTETGRPLRQTRPRRRLNALLKQAGLPRMRVYDLRHSMASLLLETGVDLKVVQERLGHSSIKLTADTYSHLTPGMQQVAVDRLDAIAC